MYSNLGRPAYGTYHFRFSRGEKSPAPASVSGLFEKECRERLKELLGSGDYVIEFLGFEAVDRPSWPLVYRVLCGERRTTKENLLLDESTLPETPESSSCCLLN